MRIALLCNAGLAITFMGKTLLIDLPNEPMEPFAALPDETWNAMMQKEPPFDQVCGLYYTHTHPDHCDLDKVQAYLRKWPDTVSFLPDEKTEKGNILIGPFSLDYQRVEHAPMLEATPPHVVTWIRAGERSIYIASDAKLDPELHMAFLKGRYADVAFWNSMYLSRPETRQLMRLAAERSYIYHMPPQRPDNFGLWKKCEKNMQRHGEDLQQVRIVDQYPFTIDL